MKISKKKTDYHHGALAEALLDAVENLATKFGLEAVTMRGCAKMIGVSPSAAFKHYADKRALLTAFAARAVHMMADGMQVESEAEPEARLRFLAVGKAYVLFALQNPAMFQAMWRRESIDCNAPIYLGAVRRLSNHLAGGFVQTIEDEDPSKLSTQEVLAWSTVHGLASLFVDGPLGRDQSPGAKIELVEKVLMALGPALQASPNR